MPADRYRIRLHLALALISAAVIAYQLALMQILSLVQWHHFAYMVIAVALLGFGAAGACLSLLRTPLMNRFSLLAPLALCSSGAAMALTTGLTGHELLRFDSLLLFTGVHQLAKLLLADLLHLIPFFLAALAIGMIFLNGSGEIGRLYCWNLTGSGAGAIIATGLFWIFPPSMLPGLVALPALAASLLVFPQGLPRSADIRQPSGECGAGGNRQTAGMAPPARQRDLLAAAIVLSGLTVAVSLLRPPPPVLSEFKGLSRALHLPETRIVDERASPYGLMQVLSSPALRHAPGLSLAYQKPIPVRKAVFNNGDWFGAVVPWREQDRESFLDYTTGALPYALGDRHRVLILDAGTGGLVSQALGRGARQVTAVEPHPVILSLLRGGLAEETGNFVRHPSLSVRNLSSRTFLFLDRSSYDLIQLPTLDAFGGNSGLDAIGEQYLLTREAFRQMWGKLTPDGVISVTCWMDYPLRRPLKIAATMTELLEAEGVGDIRSRLAAVRGWGTITILVKKTPLHPGETDKIRRFCRNLLFDPALLPGLRAEERMRFNNLQDGRFFSYLDDIVAPSRQRFYADYAFDIRPATDDRPYFSQFLRWRGFLQLAGLYGARSFPFLEVGYLIVLLTLLQTGAAAAVLILMPIKILQGGGGCRAATFLYFSGLGLGYMFVEIVLIQRFLLYFGNPVYAAAVVIGGMLICSGVGSLLSPVWTQTRSQGMVVLSGIILMILLYARFLTPLLQATIDLPTASKAVLSFFIIAPTAVVMGMPFPAGIGILNETGPQEIPWAWGINGCLSVVGTVLATVVAVELGFAWVMILAALAYGASLLAGWARLFQRERAGGWQGPC